MHEFRAYYLGMLKNVTRLAKTMLIDRTRQRATGETRTLNAWREYDALMKRLSHVRVGGKFTREDMNERR
jgi:hypothetical protein